MCVRVCVYVLCVLCVCLCVCVRVYVCAWVRVVCSNMAVAPDGMLAGLVALREAGRIRAVSLGMNMVVSPQVRLPAVPASSCLRHNVVRYAARRSCGCCGRPRRAPSVEKRPTNPNALHHFVTSL